MGNSMKSKASKKKSKRARRRARKNRKALLRLIVGGLVAAIFLSAIPRWMWKCGVFFCDMSDLFRAVDEVVEQMPPHWLTL